MTTAFSTLSLRPELLRSVEQVGYVEMTPIQEQGLPLMLAGKDVIGQAKTGSGKTAAFGLALLNAIDTSQLVTQALVLCPTRELADQVAAELRRLSQRLPALGLFLNLCGLPLLGIRTRAHELCGTVIDGVLFAHVGSVYGLIPDYRKQ